MRRWTGLHGSPLVGSNLPQPRLAPRDRAVVGHVVVQIQERQPRAQEALSLPGRQAQHQAQGDRRRDGVVRVLALSAWRPARRPRRVPVGELAIGESEPDGQTPASAETRLVLPPIPDTVGLLDVLPLGALETRHAGPRISGWRAIIDRDRELCTKAPARHYSRLVISGQLGRRSASASGSSGATASCRESPRLIYRA